MTKIIDSHVHIGKFNINRSGILGWLDVYPIHLMKYIKQEELSAVWLLSHPYMKGEYELNGSEETLVLAKSYPKIKPFCQVDYATPECIGRYVDKGCVGIGEIKLNLPLNDSKLLKVFKIAKDYDLPVVVHTTDKYCYATHYNQFKEVLDIGANIIFHGWGWWNLLQCGLMQTIIEDFSNVYMDISANSGYRILDEGIGVSKLLEEHNDRLLYGTDFPMISIPKQSDNMGTQFGIDKKHLNLVKCFDTKYYDNIFYKNAMRLVK